MYYLICSSRGQANQEQEVFNSIRTWLQPMGVEWETTIHFKITPARSDRSHWLQNVSPGTVKVNKI